MVQEMSLRRAKIRLKREARTAFLTNDRAKLRKQFMILAAAAAMREGDTAILSVSEHLRELMYAPLRRVRKGIFHDF